MTKDEALKLALEALEKCRTYHQQEWSIEETTKPEVKQAIIAIKEALAQTEQEHVQWGVDWGKAGDIPCVSIIKRLPDGGIKVLAVEYAPYSYTTSPQPEQEHFALKHRIAELEGAVIGLQAQLAQPEQEPVAWLSKGGKGIWFHEPDASLNATHLYITPPQRKPLTDEEIADLWSAQIFHINDLKLAKDFVRDIEAAHGIKE